LLAAARSRGAAGGPRCCGRGFFAYFLFLKKVREMAVLKNYCLRLYLIEIFFIQENFFI
jgi:hypothetical protein